MLEVSSLSFSYGKHAVLRDLSFCTERGEVIALLGANGAGKSTLFRLLLGFLRPDSGAVRIDGKAVSAYSHRDLAREIAYIPQSHSPTFNYTVLQSVLMGATASLGTFGSPGEHEEARAMELLSSLGIAHLAGRGCRKISGGERQLMLLCRALLQDAKILLLDEPTANLDYGNAARVMERISALGRAGYTVLFSTHEPNQAFRYATRVLALKDGALLADGVPAEVLSEELLSSLYGVSVAVSPLCVDGQEFRVSVPKNKTP